jgi:hypothetical protein
MQSSLRLPVMCNVWYFCQFSEFPPGGNWYGRPFGFGQLALSRLQDETVMKPVLAPAARRGRIAGGRAPAPVLLPLVCQA